MRDRFKYPIKDILKISKYDYILLQDSLLKFKQQAERLELILDDIADKNLERSKR